MTGIMQGRLSVPFRGHLQSFPVGSWAQEFSRAAAAGLDAIEWIYDTVGAGANPLETDGGIATVHALSQEHAVAVDSVCADWFMAHRLALGCSQDRAAALGDLRWLLARCARLGASRMVLPFVDSSALTSPSELDDAVRVLRDIAPEAAQLGVELHLETSLAPRPFRELLDRVDHPGVRVNYDIGNSASLGYCPAEELAAYGDRLGACTSRTGSLVEPRCRSAPEQRTSPRFS